MFTIHFITSQAGTITNSIDSIQENQCDWLKIIYKSNLSQEMGCEKNEIIINRLLLLLLLVIIKSVKNEKKNWSQSKLFVQILRGVYCVKIWTGII